jgi:D-alanyl-D-alanine carboxypeptidase (penicillin-binding protein 5/6)
MQKPARRFSILSVMLAATMVVASLSAATHAAAQGLYNQARYAAIVVDATSGEVLYARRADQPRYPASITKVMTVYLVFEALATGRLSLTDPVVMSRHAANQAPSKLGLRPGESLTVDQALRVVATKSANDVAVALAEKLGGTEARFAALMTLRAQEIGMTNTRFVNASGLPDTRQISTARDIAILSRAAMRDYPQYYSYFATKSTTFRGQTIPTHNRLLLRMPGFDGLKTGFTNASGYNLAGSAVRDGRRLITVVLGGNSTAARDENVEDLLNAGFDVLAKRKAGQTMTIAANMREPDDIAGPIMRPSTEQGSGEQAGLRVVVADELRGPQVATIAGGSPWARPVTSVEPSEAATAKTSSLKASAAALVAADGPAPAKPAEKVQAANCAPVKVKGKITAAARKKAAACEAAKKTATAKATPAKTPAKGDYRIQVGAFTSQKDAKAHLTKITSRFSSVVASASSQVQTGGKGAYRARFNGFSQTGAKQACAALAAKGERCLVLAPS